MITPDTLLASFLARVDLLNLPCRDGRIIAREVYSARHSYRNGGMRFRRRGRGIVSAIKTLLTRDWARLNRWPTKVWLTDLGEQTARAIVGLPGLRTALLLRNQLTTAWTDEDALLATPSDEERYRLEFDLLPAIVRGLVACQCEDGRVSYCRMPDFKAEEPAEPIEGRNELASTHYQAELLRLLAVRSSGLTADALLAL